MAQNITPAVLLCSLFYFPDSHTINQAAMQKPAVAVFGGKDGLALYRSLLNQVYSCSTKPQYTLTEALPGQHEALRGILSLSGYEQTAEEDFIQVFRVSLV